MGFVFVQCHPFLSLVYLQLVLGLHPSREPCNNPLGLENGFISDSQIMAMNSYDDDASRYGGHLARLNARRGYRADKSDAQNALLIVDFGRPVVVSEISTQGYGDSHVSEWVTKFKLFHALQTDNEFKPFNDLSGQEAIFLGNKDRSTVRQNKFAVPVIASKIMLKPVKWHNNVALRMEIYGCKPGYSFNVWLMASKTHFTVDYFMNTSEDYINKADLIMSELKAQMAFTYGFLSASLIRFSPQSQSSNMQTYVAAEIKINCLPQKEEFLAGKLERVRKSKPNIIDPSFFELQYNKCGCPPPRVQLKELSKTVNKPTIIYLNVARPLLYIASEVHSGCGNERKVITWEITHFSKAIRQFAPIAKKQEMSSSSTVRYKLFTPRLQKAELVYIRCRVQMINSRGSLAYDYGFLRVVIPNLVARIAGKKVVAKDEDIVLDASQSYDPVSRRMKLRGIRFKWSCLKQQTNNSMTKENPQECYGFGTGSSRKYESRTLRIDTKHFDVGDYVFTLMISKRRRRTSIQHKVTILPATQLKIGCELCSKRISTKERLIFNVTCLGNHCHGNGTFRWIVYMQTTLKKWQKVTKVSSRTSKNGVEFTITSFAELMLKSNKGDNHFKTEVILSSNSTIAKDSIHFAVNSGPRLLDKNGGCVVSPSSGTAASTVFFLYCHEWYDKDLPLTYEFVYHGEFGTVIFHSGLKRNTSTTLPAGKEEDGFNLKLQASVRDSKGSETKLDLIVQVEPSYDVADFHERYKKFTESASAFVRKGWTDTTAENALSLIQTAERVLPKEADKVTLKDEVLTSIQDIKLKTIPQITKVVAIVALATQRAETLHHETRRKSLNLLQRSSEAMEKYLSGDYGDLDIAKNISSTVMVGIEKIIISSIIDQDENAKYDTKTALKIVDAVADTLLSLKRVGDPPSVIKTKSINILVYRAKPEDIAGKNITEGGNGVKLPPKEILFGQNVDMPFVDFQMVAHGNNPYTWDPGSSHISSSVLDITLKKNSKKMEIYNLQKPVSLSITSYSSKQSKEPRPDVKFFIKPSNGSTNFRYHPFQITSDLNTVEFKIVPQTGKSLEIFIRAGEKPTDAVFNYSKTLPDISLCNMSQDAQCDSMDPFTIKLTSKTTGRTGLHFLGLRYFNQFSGVDNQAKTYISIRKKRDCGSMNGRQKRSCIGVKDPPTTPPTTPITIVPVYNPLTDVNYTLTSTVSFCGYWSEDQDKWTTEGCEFSSKDSNEEIHCLCNHLSAFGGDFFVAPNPIDFDKVFMEFGRLGETGNYVVLSTVCILWALYLIGLVLARKADNHDNTKLIIQMLPGEGNGLQCYKISIETGMWYGNGTTADVTISLYGTDGCSGPIYLNSSDSDKQFFSRSSINIFYVSLQHSLGTLNKIKVQHNNAGSSPSWYLKDVFVADVQSGSKWHFVADRWIAVHKNDGKLECTLEETKQKGKIAFKSVFHSRMSKKLGESHLWISLFSRPPQNPFTRCQRLSCCISVLFAAMVTNAMFYRFGIDSKDTIHIGSFKISWTEIKIGIQSALLAFPVNILIVMMFRNIKQSETAVSDIEQDVKPSGRLPRFFIYITWGICLSVSLVSSMFVVFYSLTWGASTSNQWLKSIMISFFQDSLVIQPVKIVVIAFLLSLIFRRVDDHEAVLEKPTVTKLKPSKQIYDFPSAADIEKSRHIKSKSLRLSMALIEMGLFVMFVILLTVVVYGNRGSSRFAITKHLKETFNHFHEIMNESMFWTWTTKHFAPSVYNVTWYNNASFTGPEGFTSSKAMFLVGMPRMRQIRIKPDYHCIAKASMIYFKRCVYYSAENEETSRFNWMDWTPILNASYFHTAFQLKKMCPIPWRYKTARELQTLPINGKFKRYYGGGYVADLGYNLKTAQDVLVKLKANKWIDTLTAAVLVEFTVFESSSQLFSIVKLLYERLPTGGLSLASSFQTIPVYFRKSGPSDIVGIFQPLFMVVVLLLFILELVRLFIHKCSYMKNIWNWFTLCQCFGSMVMVVIFFFKQKFASAYVKKVHENPYDTTSCDSLVFWTDIEMYTISFVMFVTTIKCLRLFRFVPQICQMTMTVKASGKYLCSYMSSFIVIILAFTQLASTIFGPVIPTYSTFIGTVSTLLQQLVGGRSYFATIRSVDPVLGPIFAFSYICIATVILVNMFIAILNENYTAVRTDRSNFPDAELGEFLISSLKTLGKQSPAKIWQFIKGLSYQRTGKYEFTSPYSGASSCSSKTKRFLKASIPHVDGFKKRKGSYDFKIIDQGHGYCYQVIPNEVIFSEYSKNIKGISYKPFTVQNEIIQDGVSTIPTPSSLDLTPRLASFDSDSSLDSLMNTDANSGIPQTKECDNPAELRWIKKSMENVREELLSLSTVTLTTNHDSTYSSQYWFSYDESDTYISEYCL